MWRLRKNSGYLECSMCRTTHTKVNPDQLLDNYVLLEYIKTQRESKDLAMAQEYQKAYNLSEGTPLASNVRRQLDISLDNFDPLQPLVDDEDEEITEWQADNSESIIILPRINDESREVIDLTLEDTLEDGPISSDHEDNVPNFPDDFPATPDVTIDNTVNLSDYENESMNLTILDDLESNINNLSDYEIDPFHQTLIEDHESSMEEGPSEQFVEPLLELLHQYKYSENMGISFMERRLLNIMSHIGIQNEMRQIVHPIIQLIQEDKLVPMGDEAFVNHLRDIVNLYLIDVDE